MPGPTRTGPGSPLPDPLPPVPPPPAVPSPLPRSPVPLPVAARFASGAIADEIVIPFGAGFGRDRRRRLEWRRLRDLRRWFGLPRRGTIPRLARQPAVGWRRSRRRLRGRRQHRQHDWHHERRRQPDGGQLIRRGRRARRPARARRSDAPLSRCRRRHAEAREARPNRDRSTTRARPPARLGVRLAGRATACAV